MTVREAVERACGPVPEWCEPCDIRVARFGRRPILITAANEVVTFGAATRTWTRCWLSHVRDFVLGPNIHDRPAEPFLGFFGDDFDRVVIESRQSANVAEVKP